ncbi:hypothetical protein PCL_01490 [Purpureocillium lilacinum]|uniref:Uncharacterized protein n=1 Tax=Purpureocillium lilacinum TaxID=33203 RepID=A0A2U3E3L3_PURLI|nr:hypothetical protein PCL_01490 [Purpureocillium lilacinum]
MAMAMDEADEKLPGHCLDDILGAWRSQVSPSAPDWARPAVGGARTNGPDGRSTRERPATAARSSIAVAVQRGRQASRPQRAPTTEWRDGARMEASGRGSDGGKRPTPRRGVTCVRLANPPGALGGEQEKAALTWSGHALSVALQTLATGLRPVRPQRKNAGPG